MFKNSIITVALAALVSVPSFAASQTFTCEQTTDARGNVIYVPVKKIAKAKVKPHHRRVARAKKRVIRDESKVVYSAPVVVKPAPAVIYEPVVREKTAAEKRAEWLREHTPNAPIYGNMSGWAGRSTIGYLHGTDNPEGKLALDSDIGPSAGDYRNTATDTNDNF